MSTQALELIARQKHSNISCLDTKGGPFDSVEIVTTSFESNDHKQGSDRYSFCRHQLTGPVSVGGIFHDRPIDYCFAARIFAAFDIGVGSAAAIARTMPPMRVQMATHNKDTIAARARESSVVSNPVRIRIAIFAV